MTPFEEHLSELQGLLAGKDPRRVADRKAGRALLVLDDEGDTRRVMITIDKKNVQVAVTGATPEQDEAFAVVKSSFADWLRFFRDASDESLSALKLYGDMDVIATVGALLTVERSFIDVRAGGR